MVGEAAGLRGWGKEGGGTLFTCISLFLALSHFTSSSSPFFVGQNNEIHLIVIGHDLHLAMTVVG